MGRPYQSELEALSSTAEWVASLDLSGSTASVSRLHCRDLVVIASGGSVAAAQLLAQIHTFHTGRLAIVMTPLEFVAETYPLEAVAWFISAGGANNDILQAWLAAPIRGVQDVALLCASTGSPLAQLAREARIQTAIVFDVPAGRDGFLATNSLIAFCGVILRLYGTKPRPLPKAPYRAESTRVLERQTLVVLYGGWLKTVAIDLESRFTEAALGSVQTADYRNFAHGRHHWLAKRGADSAVLALISPNFADLARDTLAHVPVDVPVECWEFPNDSPESVMDGLQRTMELAGVAAARLGYDAGRPGVPEFGHHIYDLKTPPRRHLPTTAEVAIARKLRAFSILTNRDDLLPALGRFQTKLHNARLSGIVLDYDGTIVATDRRFDAIAPSVAAELNRMLKAGLLIGVATGRGKSVHDKLRAAIASDYWSRCTIGYYNGGTVRSLEESCEGLADVIGNTAIAEADLVLRRAPELNGACFDTRPLQITVTRADFGEHRLWMSVRRVLERSSFGTLRVVHSSHSVDVIPSNVSKAAVVNDIAVRANAPESAILKIGDRGQWPGNDADLLAMSNGLSVDEVSENLESCWNLVPAGLLGPLATLYYLERVRDQHFVADISAPEGLGDG